MHLYAFGERLGQMPDLSVARISGIPSMGESLRKELGEGTVRIIEARPGPYRAYRPAIALLGLSLIAVVYRSIRIRPAVPA